PNLEPAASAAAEGRRQIGARRVNLRICSPCPSRKSYPPAVMVQSAKTPHGGVAWPSIPPILSAAASLQASRGREATPLCSRRSWRFRKVKFVRADDVAAKDLKRDNVSSAPVDRACAGCVLPERNISSRRIVIGSVFRKNSKVLCSRIVGRRRPPRRTGRAI